MSAEVGGAPMYPSKNIVENIVISKEHTLLVAPIKTVGLVETPRGEGSLYGFRSGQRRIWKAAEGGRGLAFKTG
jgi:hypothetical protein